jgi:hypothetical protein
MQTFEAIRTRLLTQAAGRFHCKPETLNPEVRLFADWMAWELNSLHREVGRSNDAIRRRLERQLTPDTSTRPFPTHALAYAQPKKETYSLRPDEDVFNVPRHAPTPPYQIFFSPLKSSNLLKAKVKYLAAGQTFWEMQEPLTKHARLQTRSGTNFHPGILWVGVTLEAPLSEGQNLCFCVEWNIESEKRRAELTSLLPMTHWQCAGQTLAVQTGFAHAAEARHTSNFLDAEYLHLYAIEKQILKQYEKRFITVSPENQWIKMPLPAELQEKFETEALDELLKGSEILWLRVSFPTGITPEEVRQLALQLNCFPVVNRRIENRDTPPSGSDGFEIIPLSNAAPGRAALNDMGCHFLAIQRVFTKNHEYRPVVFDNFRAAAPGNYALQHGRVEADDLRDLYARIGELAHLLQTEASKLTLVSPHTISQALADIERGAANLETSLSAAPPKDLDPGYYLHLKILDPQDMLFIRFWLTQGEYAHSIAAPGDLLMAENANVFAGDGAVLVTGVETLPNI